MLLSFLLLGGFMYWLYATAEPTEPVVIEEEEPEDAGPAATDVDVGALNLSADSYLGQRVRISNVGVASAVGSEAFFLDIQPPFLVSMDTTLMARGMAVPTGQTVTVVGTMHTMTDSVVSAWVSSGAISEGDRPIVEFATHFIEAHRIQTSGGGQGGQSAGN